MSSTRAPTIVEKDGAAAGPHAEPKSELDGVALADAEANPAAPPAGAGFTVPDGGWEAWSVVVGGWFALFATFGYVSAFGVYQVYYVNELGMSNSSVAWIGSFQLWIQYALGLGVGRLFDEGYGRQLIIGGSILYALSIFMTSLATTYTQIFLAQGLAGGLGFGILFLPALSVIPHWFKRRRALATGIVVSGSSVGGVCLPIMLNNLFISIGYAKAVRATGYLLLGCLVIACVLIKPRLPPRKLRPPHMQFPAPDMKAIFGHTAYWLTTAALFLMLWGVFYPMFYLQVYAESKGFRESIAFYSLAFANASSVVGRVLPNFFADRFGVFNVLIAASAGIGITLFCWLAVTNEGGFIAFAVVFGLFQGAFVSLMPGCFQSLSSHLGEIGVRMGLAWAVMSFAALTGTPIDGALLGSELHWWKATVFSGVCVAVAVVLLIVARGMHARALGKAFI